MLNPPREPSDAEPVTPRLLRQLIGYTKSITPRSSNKCRVHRTTGGTTFEPTAKTQTTRGGGNAAPVKYHPFQIVDASTTVATQIQVSNGTLLEPNKFDEAYTIDNLGSDISVTADSLIYLFYDDSTGVFSITAESRSSLSTWSGYGAPVTITGSGFTSSVDKWFMLVGYVSTTLPSDPETTPGVELTVGATDCFAYQCLFTNLQLQNICINGTPVDYPYPWAGAGPA